MRAELPLVGLPAMDTQMSLDIPKRLLPPHSHTRVRHSTHPVHLGFASSACVPTCFGLLPETPLGKPHHHTPPKRATPSSSWCCLWRNQSSKCQDFSVLDKLRQDLLPVGHTSSLGTNDLCLYKAPVCQTWE